MNEGTQLFTITLREEWPPNEIVSWTVANLAVLVRVNAWPDGRFSARVSDRDGNVIADAASQPVVVLVPKSACVILQHGSRTPQAASLRTR